jgi:hypothetical protein
MNWALRADAYFPTTSLIGAIVPWVDEYGRRRWSDDGLEPAYGRRRSGGYRDQWDIWIDAWAAL